MPVPFTIRCSSCSTKLNIKKESLVGRKIACPKCKTTVHIVEPTDDSPDEEAPTAASEAIKAAIADDRPKKRKSSKPKKKTAAAKKNDFDDFADDDFYEDDDYGDDGFDDYEGDDYDDYEDDFEDDFEEPRRKSSSKAKPAGKGAKAKSKGKSGGGSKGLIIALSLVGVLLAGGAAWFLIPKDNDANTIADTDPTADGDPAAAAAAAMGGGEAGGGGAAETISESDASMPLEWLPAKTQAIVRIDFKSLYNGPVVQKILENPMLSGGSGGPGLEQIEQAIGVSVADIDSIIVGVDDIPGVDDMSPGAPGAMPQGNPNNGLVVIRLSKDLSADKLKSLTAQVQEKSHGGTNYLMMPGAAPGQPPSGVYLADNKTVVMGPEKAVQTAIDQGSSRKVTTDFSWAKADGANVVIAFHPQNAGQFLNNIPDNQPSVPPNVQNATRAIKEHLRGLCIGLNLTEDLGVQLSIKCDNSSGATSIQSGLQDILTLGKQSVDGALQSAGFMERPFIMMGQQMLENSSLDAADDVVVFKGTSEKAGITLANQVGILAPMAMAQIQGAMGGMGGGGGFPGGPGQGGFPGGPENGGFPGGPGGPPGMNGGDNSGDFPTNGISGDISADQFPLGGFNNNTAGAGQEGEKYVPSDPNNMKKIAAGMHAYHDDENSLPDVAILDESGTPLLSWRVRILPYIGHKDLYDRFHLDEPWDSRHNKELINEMPRVFGVPASGKTSFVAATGPGTVFENGRGRKMFDVTDPLDETIMLLDGGPGSIVTWTQPKDFVVGQARLPRFSACMVDGEVRQVSGAEAGKMFTCAADD